MAADTPEVVIHGGVHKTATSHIQSIMQRNAGRLRKSGVHYVHHRITRKEYTVPIQLNQYRRPQVTDAELAENARAFFSGVPAGPGDRIVLSDENMAGHSGHCVRGGGIYQRSDVLLPIFARLVPYPVTEVHIAIRNYADFFASTFVEFLRSATGDKLIPEAQMKRAVLSNLPGWTGFIDLVLACFPNARLTIWRHEDFRALSGRIIGNLCGPAIDVGALAAPGRQRTRPTASHRAVQELLMEAEHNGGDVALARRVEIQEAYPRGPEFPGYDPWSAEERAHLVRLYDKDLAEILTRDRISYLAP